MKILQPARLNMLYRNDPRVQATMVQLSLTLMVQAQLQRPKTKWKVDNF